MIGDKMDLYGSRVSVANPPPPPPQTGDSASASQFYTSKYIRNSRAIGVLWAAFTLCTAVLDAAAFASSNWAGDTAESRGPGHFGLWRFCTVLSASSGGADSGELSASPTADAASVICIGDLNNFASILSPAFRASTVFVGLSVIVLVLCVLAFLLFCFMRHNSVYELCGTMQFLAGICLLVGLVSFPAGWDNDHVRSICGPDADDFVLGTCGVRWAFVLAVISLFDCLVLGCLAFTLAHRTVYPEPASAHAHNSAESHYASIYNKGGHDNHGFLGENLGGSRKSLLQPVVMVPQGGHPPPGSVVGGGPPPPPPPFGPPPPLHPDEFEPQPGYDPRPGIHNFQL